MNLKCVFGHKWNGCYCSRCGERRDEQHDWDLCKGICKACRKTQVEQHDWDGCKCSRCGTVRDEQHDWSANLCGSKCSRCGKWRKVKDEQHDWSTNFCYCSRCGYSRDIEQIDDESILAEIAKVDVSSSIVTEKAAAKLTNQTLLIDVAKNAIDFSTRVIAINKINDQSVLKEIVFAEIARNNARNKSSHFFLDYSSHFCLRSRSYKVQTICQEAISRISDEEFCENLKKEKCHQWKSIGRCQKCCLICGIIEGRHNFEVGEVSYYDVYKCKICGHQTMYEDEYIYSKY